MTVKRLTQKQEIFCLKYFELRNATEAALQAGYSPRGVRVTASKMLTKANIRTRIDELGEEVKRAAVMNVQERMERLTEIGRAKLTDFMELGQDGSWVNIGPEVPMTGAILAIHSRTEYDDDGSKPTVHTSVKLHDPMKAIDLLNKMDKIYQDGATVNIDNRHLEIIVRSENTKELLEEIAQGIEPHAVANDQSI